MVWTLPKHQVETFERNTLASVVVELRFQPILKIAENVADFQEKVRPRFPGYESVESRAVEIGPGGVQVRELVAHRFTALGEPSAASLSTSSLNLEYSAHKSRSILLSDVDIAIDALVAAYAPVIPIRLGLRYVNLLRRELFIKDLQRPLAWSDILTTPFSTVPGEFATADENTNFLVEITSPCERGAMTLRYGLLPGKSIFPHAPLEGHHYRLDTDRYIEGGFATGEARTLLEVFSEDIFHVFMTAAGPGLREWMTAKGPMKGKGEAHD